MRSTKLPLIFCCFILLAGCKKLVEVDVPKNATSNSNVYTDPTTAAAVLTGIYANMSALNSAGDMQGMCGLSLYPSMSADELSVFDQNNAAYLLFARNDLNSRLLQGNFWLSIYPMIYVTNAAIEGLTRSQMLPAAVKNQLLGEARFMRAFGYFYLVNMYGDVPLVVTTDQNINALLRRSPKNEVYDLIIKDLKEAQNLLSALYLDGNVTTITNERVRPSKWAATALLARALLYNGNFEEAATEATKVINNTSLFNLPPPGQAFLSSSMEAIWQLQATGIGEISNTGEGALFVLPSTGPSFQNPVYLNPLLIKAFEKGDQRKTTWTGYVIVAPDTFYYANKYKIGRINASREEYSVIFRLAEQYLIRAEARIRSGNISDGIADLNVLRIRATDLSLPLSDQLSQLSQALTEPDALRALEYERRMELFTEWGHRWLDLKRTAGFTDPTKTRADEILKPLKGNTWQSTDQWYPIPLQELQSDPNLRQNDGYQ